MSEGSIMTFCTQFVNIDPSDVARCLYLCQVLIDVFLYLNCHMYTSDVTALLIRQMDQ